MTEREEVVSLQELLKNIKHFFGFLFQEYDFSIVYTFERPYPVEIRVGLATDRLPIKLLFVHEWATSLRVGSKNADFMGDDDWYDVERLIDFIEQRPMRWPPGKLDIPYPQFLLRNLQEIAEELHICINKVIALFCDKNTKWRDDYREFVVRETLRRYPSLKQK